MTSNMRIWSGVQKTDPAYTKRVNQRGGFTAIDAHYQVMRATETFGPVGIGWGYECGAPIFHGDMVIIPVTLWHGDRANSFGPVYGCAQMLGQRPDTDAPKKAMTDALTKALSHLGFNADVFLGKFDDSKYVAEVKAEFQSASQPSKAADAADVREMIGKAKTIEALNTAWHRTGEALRKDAAILAAFSDRKAEINKEQGKSA